MEKERLRFGKIKITKEAYEGFWENMPVELTIIPYRVEYRQYSRTYEIEAYCNLFDEIEEGAILPLYLFDFIRVDVNLYKGIDSRYIVTGVNRL